MSANNAPEVIIELDEIDTLTRNRSKDSKAVETNKDNESLVDYILVYNDDDNDLNETKRKKYLEILRSRGLIIEEAKMFNGRHFVKVTISDETLKVGAEVLSIRVHQHDSLCSKEFPWYKDVLLKMGARYSFLQVFEPANIDEILKRHHYKSHDNGYSRAQRIAVTKFILEFPYNVDGDNRIDSLDYPPGDDDPHCPPGDDPLCPPGDDLDYPGVSSLIQEEYFDAAYPLHDGDYFVETDQIKDETIELNERQLLYHEWSHLHNWYKYQPLDNIRHYFGERLGLYFAWIGFYTSWLFWAAIVGIIVTVCGLYTLSTNSNPQAKELCNEEYREFFYMCPLCSDTCDFWYYKSACLFANVTLLFDNGGTVFFALFMALWAVLFEQFWKRQESHLQYKWDTYRYEQVEVRERPEFLYTIKRKRSDRQQQYRKFNRFLNRYEFFQPPKIFWPKILIAFSVVSTFVLVVVGIVIVIIIYRLAVSRTIYQVIHKFNGSPATASLITIITGTCFQLIAIFIMDIIYKRVAVWLTKWELHRTDSQYRDSYTFKMYLFDFINYYSSLFYIAFFKGKFTGYPGNYSHIASFRLDECAAYGCLLELTIQLAIIFVGKQILYDIVEFGIPRLKVWKILRNASSANKDPPVHQWEKDELLIELPEFFLFSEYIKLVIQYGFVTIFVAAFPLAPLFAWVNNVIEIRLDANKYVKLFHRPIPERTQTIGAWHHITHFTTILCVITNGFVIAFTSSIIDRAVYNSLYVDERSGNCNDNDNNCSNGFVAWSTSTFSLNSLHQPKEGSPETDFPFLSVLRTPLYMDGNIVMRESIVGKNVGRFDSILYLPFLNFTCLENNFETDFEFEFLNFTTSEFKYFYTDPVFQNLTLRTVNRHEDGQVLAGSGECFIDNTQCRFRGQAEPGGEYPVKYWRTLAYKLIFMILFENIVFLIGYIIGLIIPDKPSCVKNEIRREKFMLSKRIADLERIPHPDRSQYCGDCETVLN